MNQLPPLPEPVWGYVSNTPKFSAEQMRDYARAAVAHEQADHARVLALQQASYEREMALDRAALAQQPIPSGWRMVPETATPEMIAEVETAARMGGIWTAASAYRAMLDAAPQQTAPQCACTYRPASHCPGEWEPGCDLGNNPAHARVAQQAAPVRLAEAAHGITAASTGEGAA